MYHQRRGRQSLQVIKAGLRSLLITVWYLKGRQLSLNGPFWNPSWTANNSVKQTSSAIIHVSILAIASDCPRICTVVKKDNRKSAAKGNSNRAIDQSKQWTILLTNHTVLNESDNHCCLCYGKHYPTIDSIVISMQLLCLLYIIYDSLLNLYYHWYLLKLFKRAGMRNELCISSLHAS